MALGVVAVRRQRRRVVTAPGEGPSGVLTHLAVAITRYARQLRNDGLPVPPTLDELAAFLTLYVRTRHAATGVDGGFGTPQAVPMMSRLLITKAEAAERLAVSVRTVERLITAGRLPLVHVEGAARLRVADLEAYVDALVPLDTEQYERGNAD
jgi:excisionase family DNA binding protein